MIQKLTFPLRVITLISKTTPHFCHKWQRIRVSSRHLISRASISIIIIRSIIVITTIIILIFRIKIRSHWRRWRRSLRSKIAHDRQPSSNTIDTSVRLLQLCRECIKASIHALKLCQDVSWGHIAYGRGRSRCGWSETRWNWMTVTPIPDCEWQWEGQCRRSPPKWLGVLNEYLV